MAKLMTFLNKTIKSASKFENTDYPTSDEKKSLYYQEEHKPISFYNPDNERIGGLTKAHYYKEGIVIKVLGVKIFDNVHDATSGDDLEVDENIESITVEYMGGGQVKKWSVSEDLIDDMIEWVSDLDYKKVQFEEGRTPADGEGQAVYSLEFSDGTEFAYYNCGTEHYIRMADTWYQVKNPKLPPVGEPV